MRGNPWKGAGSTVSVTTESSLKKTVNISNRKRVKITFDYEECRQVFENEGKSLK